MVIFNSHLMVIFADDFCGFGKLIAVLPQFKEVGTAAIIVSDRESNNLSVDGLCLNSALICRHRVSGGFGGAPKPHHCMNHSPETEND